MHATHCLGAGCCLAAVIATSLIIPPSSFTPLSSVLQAVTWADTTWGGLKAGQVIATPQPVFARMEDPDAAEAAPVVKKQAKQPKQKKEPKEPKQEKAAAEVVQTEAAPTAA